MLNSECREDEASKLLKGGGKRAFIVASRLLKWGWGRVESFKSSEAIRSRELN